MAAAGSAPGSTHKRNAETSHNEENQGTSSSKPTNTGTVVAFSAATATRFFQGALRESDDEDIGPARDGVEHPALGLVQRLARLHVQVVASPLRRVRLLERRQRAAPDHFHPSAAAHDESVQPHDHKWRKERPHHPMNPSKNTHGSSYAGEPAMFQKIEAPEVIALDRNPEP